MLLGGAFLLGDSVEEVPATTKVDDEVDKLAILEHVVELDNVAMTSRPRTRVRVRFRVRVRVRVRDDHIEM